jgi:hypothetical protein
MCIHHRTVYKHLSSFTRGKRAPFSVLGFCWRLHLLRGDYLSKMATTSVDQTAHSLVMVNATI